MAIQFAAGAAIGRLRDGVKRGAFFGSIYATLVTHLFRRRIIADRCRPC